MNFIRLPAGNVDIHVAALAGIVNFTPDMQLALQVQYDNISGNFTSWAASAGSSGPAASSSSRSARPRSFRVRRFLPTRSPNSRPRICRSASSEPSSSEPLRTAGRTRLQSRYSKQLGCLHAIRRSHRRADHSARYDRYGTTTIVDIAQTSYTPEHSDACIGSLQEVGIRAVHAYSRGAEPGARYLQDMRGCSAHTSTRAISFSRSRWLSAPIRRRCAQRAMRRTCGPAHPRRTPSLSCGSPGPDCFVKATNHPCHAHERRGMQVS